MQKWDTNLSDSAEIRIFQPPWNTLINRRPDLLLVYPHARAGHSRCSQGTSQHNVKEGYLNPISLKCIS